MSDKININENWEWRNTTDSKGEWKSTGGLNYEGYACFLSGNLDYEKSNMNTDEIVIWSINKWYFNLVIILKYHAKLFRLFDNGFELLLFALTEINLIYVMLFSPKNEYTEKLVSCKKQVIFEVFSSVIYHPRNY